MQKGRSLVGSARSMYTNGPNSFCRAAARPRRSPVNPSCVLCGSVLFGLQTKSEVRNLRQAGRSQLHKLQFKSHAIDETQRRELDVGLTNLMEAYVTKCDKVFNEKFQELRLADTH